MGFFRDERIDDLVSMVRNLTERIQKLEAEAKYYADQPQYPTFITSLNAYNYDFNVVPLNQVVKAIVKHLDMQIEKVPEQTINKPVEVNVVPKPQMMVGATGVVTMTDGSGITMPGSTGTWTSTVTTEKPKRKYTKRKQAVKKQVVKPAVKKTTRKTK